MHSKILIVEDETNLREVLCDYFRSKGELPFEASDGMQALSLIEENEYDAVLLDIMMPKLDGLSVCRAVRKTNDIPIIFLTALSDEEDKLLGYELGADDYVTKPFTMSVLYAKTMALIKRNQRTVLSGVVRILTSQVPSAGKKTANSFFTFLFCSVTYILSSLQTPFNVLTFFYNLISIVFTGYLFINAINSCVKDEKYE